MGVYDRLELAKTRETKDGWPLLAVETEVNGGSKSTNKRGCHSLLALWVCRAGTRDFCSALAALVSPVLPIHGPMINTANMPLMRVNPLRGQVRGWALEIETFLGPMKWHRAVRRVPLGN